MPLQLALICWGVGIYVNRNLSFWGNLGWVLSMEVMLSIVSHELVHHKSRFEQVFGGIRLACVCNVSFKIEHVHEHHQYVATPMDAFSDQWESVLTSRFPEQLFAISKAPGVWGQKDCRSWGFLLALAERIAGLFITLFVFSTFDPYAVPSFGTASFLSQEPSGNCTARDRQLYRALRTAAQKTSQ